jgi:hypothetical protein
LLVSWVVHAMSVVMVMQWYVVKDIDNGCR